MSKWVFGTELWFSGYYSKVLFSVSTIHNKKNLVEGKCRFWTSKIKINFGLTRIQTWNLYSCKIFFFFPISTWNDLEPPPKLMKHWVTKLGTLLIKKTKSSFSYALGFTSLISYNSYNQLSTFCYHPPTGCMLTIFRIEIPLNKKLEAK